ncbi:MAG: gliding motility-associated C-terminal domain-containing protein [Sphingobacteriales bacterium]
MRPRIIRLFLTVIILLITVSANAQTCSGALGDPIILQTFGSGTNPGLPLPAGVTNFIYTTNKCAEDGYYTILNSSYGCHTDWHDVIHDHTYYTTGDPNGYFMLVNASFEPSIFFTQKANGLCPNTVYEFSAYIMNLGTLASLSNKYTRPDITFSVETAGGQVLATYNTGEIKPTSSPEWTKYGTYFTTPAGVTDVIVKMSNNAAGGMGNDLLLDDIAFRACGPVVLTGFGDLTTTATQTMCKGTSADYKLTASVGTGYVNPFLQWQVNYNNTGWVNIPGQTGTTADIQFNNAVPGTYLYRLSVGEGQNEPSPTCNVSSEPLSVVVSTESNVVATVSGSATLCAGASTQLNASGGLYYQWTPSTGLDHDNIADPVATPTQTTTYSVKVSNDGCFDDTKTVTVTVNANPTASAGNDKVIFKGESTVLNGIKTGDNITSAYWTPATGLDNPFSLTPTANPTESTTYTLHVVSQSCGTVTSSVNVTVYTKITVPNTFSPNGDGVNDFWDIGGLITFPESLTTVYTRDGQQVFKSTGYAKPWDGTYNGAQVPGGTYYYVIDPKNGMPVLSGWVLVVR